MLTGPASLCRAVKLAARVSMSKLDHDGNAAAAQQPLCALVPRLQRHSRGWWGMNHPTASQLFSPHCPRRASVSFSTPLPPLLTPSPPPRASCLPCCDLHNLPRASVIVLGTSPPPRASLSPSAISALPPPQIATKVRFYALPRAECRLSRQPSSPICQYPHTTSNHPIAILLALPSPLAAYRYLTL